MSNDMRDKIAKIKESRRILAEARNAYHTKIKQMSVYHDVKDWLVHYIGLCGNPRNKK